MTRNYPEPFLPQSFSCRVTKTSTKVTVIDKVSGEHRTRPADRWDVKGKADGIEFAKRFKRVGLADTWRDQLERGYAAGLLFDLAAKRFVAPAQTQPTTSVPDVPTVFSLTESFYWTHPEWEPRTKLIAAASFNRARRWLLAPGVTLEGQEARAVDDFLSHASLSRS